MSDVSASYRIHDLQFIKPARTSRNSLLAKRMYVLQLDRDGKTGYGEISPFEGLSIDAVPHFEYKLQEVMQQIMAGHPPHVFELHDWPSIRFGLETAWLDLNARKPFHLFDNAFSRGESGIPINGLVWMAEPENMLQQVEDKIKQGYTCVKLKVGALDFDQECRMLETIRKKYSAFQIELRVDANGAFPPDLADEMLRELSRFELHSIEQPIATYQWDAMAKLCRESKLDIALDEELIGRLPDEEGIPMLKDIQPAYIILKPGLLGGFYVCDDWIRISRDLNIGWWITSALESNIGLNAIAQYTASKNVTMPQGLGTGQLFKNNIDSPLSIENGKLFYRSNASWEIDTVAQ